MGKPFVVYQEPVPIRQNELQSQRMSGSSDVSSQDGNLNSSTATLATKLSPMQDAVHAAETYFQEVEQRSNARHGTPRTLFEMLVDETQKSAKIARKQQRTSIDDGNSRWPTEANGTMSPAQTTVDLEVPGEFSLDDSDNGPYESMFSPPAVSSSDKVQQDVAHGRDCTNIPGENSELLEGSRFQSPEESSPQGEATAFESVESQHSPGEEHPHDLRDGDSSSTFEWNAVLRRSARSPDSLSLESFKTGRSGISSTSSRGSLSDEAISERVAEWGTGVARLVLKNSSRESTPRTSNGSLADGFHCTQKAPGVSKQIKDALSSFQLAFFVCDVIDPEHPILYASAGFFEMTGYSPEEVIGRNCRFLHGVDTDANEVARVLEALKKGESYTGTLLNYKKNGAPFWNLLTLSPISDEKGLVIKYMGMQAEVNSHTVIARRKNTARDTNCKHIPKSPCHSIAEIAPPPSKRSERENDMPVFTPSRLKGTTDRNGRSQGSKRYSLTIGPRRSMETQGSKRYSLTYGPRLSMDSWQQRPIEGSERQSLPTGFHHSLALEQQPLKSNSAARPFYWLMTAARILEEEIQQLGHKKNIANERPETFIIHEERKGGMKNKNCRIGRVTKGVLRLFRKLERKVLKRRKASVPSNRVNACSDSEIDDLPELRTPNNFYAEGPDLRCESMPHIDSVANSLMQADLRVRSNRYVSAGMSDSFNRKQFCIVHE